MDTTNRPLRFRSVLQFSQFIKKTEQRRCRHSSSFFVRMGTGNRDLMLLPFINYFISWYSIWLFQSASCLLCCFIELDNGICYLKICVYGQYTSICGLVFNVWSKPYRVIPLYRPFIVLMFDCSTKTISLLIGGLDRKHLNNMEGQHN